LVYYRNYCEQEDGSFLWETEKQINEILPSVVNLGVFRTNDYRIGFLTENNVGNINLILTTRSWSGMASPPENISASINEIEIDVYSVTNIDNQYEEHISSLTTVEVYCIDPTITIETLSIVRQPSKSIMITFNYPIEEIDIPNLLIYSSIKDEGTTTFAIDNIIQLTDNSVEILLVNNLSMANLYWVMNYPTIRFLTFRINQTAVIALDVFSFESPGQPPNSIHNLSATINNIVITNTLVYHTSIFSPVHNVSSMILIDLIVVTKVGSNPL